MIIHVMEQFTHFKHYQTKKGNYVFRLWYQKISSNAATFIAIY